MGASAVDVIRGDLYALGDPDYAAFTARLVPTVSPKSIIGVRVPLLRKYARSVPYDVYEPYFASAPHEFLDESNLHACLIALIKGEDALYRTLERFLPHLDNWMTTDMLDSRLFRRNTARLSAGIAEWLSSPHPFTVRFGIVMRMKYFLTEEFSPCYHDEIAALPAENYYVGMASAWYFATALCKRYDQTLPYMREGRLAPTVRRMAFRKAYESLCLTDGQKGELRSLQSEQCKQKITIL